MKKKLYMLIAAVAAAGLMTVQAMAAETISFWHIATNEPDKTIWSYGVDQYNANDAEGTGFTVEQIATVNDQYKQKLAVAMASG